MLATAAEDISQPVALLTGIMAGCTTESTTEQKPIRAIHDGETDGTGMYERGLRR